MNADDADRKGQNRETPLLPEEGRPKAEVVGGEKK
jgi:hypothetical protein